MDWELMSEQIVRHVEGCLPPDSNLSYTNQRNMEEPSANQEPTVRDNDLRASTLVQEAWRKHDGDESFRRSPAERHYNVTATTNALSDTR
ncbi:unnamed protein product, partial [Ectocarpus sp. 12 AP-2014]